MVTTDDIAAAAERIGSHIEATPLVVSEPMTERAGAVIAIKAEHAQRTGSFKIRGALNKLLTLDDDGRSRGVITASSGNHGIASATAAQIVGVALTVYLPTGASPAKVRAIERLGADIVTVDSTDAYLAERTARATAEADGRAYISPYNDPAVVAGQGTIGVELVADAPSPADAVVVAVGGGGLITGIATYLETYWPDTSIVGASPANDAVMAASIEAGSVVEIEAEPTFSDGTAGGVEPDTITFEPCRRLVDEWVSVTETEIATAVAAMVDDHHQLVEGSAGVALAAAHRWASAHPGSKVIAVSCGANVTSAKLAEMLAASSLP